MTMRATLRGFLSWIVGFIGLLALTLTVLIVWNQRISATHRSNQSAPARPESPNVISQMVDYTKAGRYDDAVRLGLQALQNQPNDESVYQQIADIYLIRAKKEPDQREQWVVKAVSYIEKALLLNSKDSDVAGVHLFQDARAFDLSGDLSASERCNYYDRARKILEARIPLLQGDQVEIAGKAFPLAPLRAENARVLDEVKRKAANAGCK